MLKLLGNKRWMDGWISSWTHFPAEIPSRPLLLTLLLLLLLNETYYSGIKSEDC